jgi:hypothetical protein
MSDVQSLNHSRWECKYHMTWIPKCRRKILYGGLRKYLGGVFRDLARRKECEILEGHSDGRPRSHARIYPTQIRRIAGHRLSERQKRHSCSPGLHG